MVVAAFTLAHALALSLAALQLVTPSVGLAEPAIAAMLVIGAANKPSRSRQSGRSRGCARRRCQVSSRRAC